MLLVKALPKWRKNFGNFFATPPHRAMFRIVDVAPPGGAAPGARPVQLTPHDVDAIVAHAETLAATAR